MDGQATTVLLRCFADLPDPRAHNVIHKLHDMLVLAVCAVICGADGWVEVELFAKGKQAWFQSFLDLPGDIPSHDTFNRLFARLQPDTFERCFVAWTRTLAGSGKLIAIDGKSIRRSFEHAWDKSGMAHLVSAFVADNHLVFAQVAVKDKSNEITAIPQLLRLLDLHGTTVTIDAIGCQREIAQQIVDGGGDYVLSLKENQPILHQKVKTMLDEAILQDFAGMNHSSFESKDDGHGRLETRRVWVTDEVHWIQQRLEQPWPYLGAVAAVECVRQDLGDYSGKVTTERRYFLCSAAGTDAKTIGQAVRGHWAVENNLHWQLDVTFGEDQRRIRTGYGAENYSRLCRLALNLLKRDKSVKVGIHGKQMKALMDAHYLLRLLTQ